MATTIRVLAQAYPTTTNETFLYSGTTTSTVISSLVVCNQGATAQYFNISVSVGGAATATKDYLYYNVIIAGYDTFVSTIGITCATGDTIRVKSTIANQLSFAIFGQENS